MKRFLIGLTICLTLLVAAPASAQFSSGTGAAALSGDNDKWRLLPSCLNGPQVQNIGFSDCIIPSITHFTNLLLVVIAVGAFLYLLYGAFLYTTAFGDENKVKTAKGVIKYALIGIIIASLSVAVVSLLADILNVNVPIDALK